MYSEFIMYLISNWAINRETLYAYFMFTNQKWFAKEKKL